MFRLIPYHLQLAARSLRRDAAMSLIMFFALTVGAGTWCLAVSQYTRFNGYDMWLSPTLHQVEVLRPRGPSSVFEEASANPYMEVTALMSRNQISYPEFQTLAGIRAPARQTAGIRSEVLVRGPDSPVQARIARFTNADFFAMFERAFASGGPWPAADDEAGSDVVVLGRATARALFPRGDAVGRTVHVEGHPYRVVGVLRAYQPLNAPWQLLMTGGFEDALFLPLGEFNRLATWPEEPILRTPVAPGRAALLKSDALFVTYWSDLPTATQKAEYARALDDRLGRGRYVLRSLPEWRRDLAMPTSQISFFSFMGAIVLLGGGFNLSRWLLIKGLSRGPELGIFRALGAPRSSLFWRVVAEATLFAFPVALLAPIAALPTVWLFNRYVHVVDMPLELGPVALVVSVGGTFMACILGSLYPAWRLSRTAPSAYLGRS